MTKSPYHLLFAALLVVAQPTIAVAAGNAVGGGDVNELHSLVEAGKYQEALARSQVLIAREGDNARLHLAYAKILRLIGQNDKAIQEYERAAVLDPSLVEPLVALSEIYLQNLDIERALETSQRALQESPHSVAARLTLVSALMQSDRFSDAEHQLGIVLQSEPNNPNALYLAYQFKVRKGDFQQARRYLQEAVAKQPTREDWKLELSQLLESAGQDEAARRCLQSIIEQNPQSTEARLRLARNIEVYQRNYDEAIEQYQKVLQLDPHSELATIGSERCKSKRDNLALRIKLELRSLLHLK